MRLARLERCRDCRARLGLDGVEARAGPQRGERARDPGEEPAAAPGDEHRVRVRDLLGELEAGEPCESPSFRASFVDGAGAKVVLPAMWERARPLLAGAYTVSLDETAAAVRLLAERARVVAEGAGALAVAAALSGEVPGRKLVCIVSGGNIDSARLAAILRGETPD